MIRSLLGFGHFAMMVDPESGAPLLQRAQRLAAQYAPPLGAAPEPAAFRKAASRRPDAARPAMESRGATAASAGPGAGGAGAQEEKKRAAQARTATPGMSRPPNVPQSPWGAPQRRRPAGGSPAGPATASKRRQPWYVTALVILLAVMLALAIRPGGAVVAGAMLFLYFW